MRWRAGAGITVAIVTWLALLPAVARADRTFDVRFSTNDTGAIAIAAAPLMTCSTGGTNGGQCADARNQDASNGPVGSTDKVLQNNNSFTMVNVDTDGDATTTVNSSTALLALPAGATVLFAGLYWGADTSAGGNGGAAPPGSTAANRIKFKAPGGSYATLSATTTDVGTGTNTNRYQSFVDVTARVRAAGSGTYSAGDVRAGTGGDRYAGWSLVVAYRDTAQPARNLTVFDGFRTIAPNSAPTTIPVSGFQTPTAGPVRTTLGFVSYEGDLGYGGDTASLNTTTLFNATNQATNFFNGSISAGGVAVTTRNPAYRNALGYDSDFFSADGVLTNGATDATILLTTNNDQYLPGVVTFATELYAPAVSLDKGVTNLTHPGGPDQRGDVLRYTVTARNTGQDGADNFILTDPVPAGATYVPGSLRIAGAAVTDADGDDRGEFSSAANQVVYRLGTGANATLGGRLAPNASVPVSFDVRIGNLRPRSEVVNAAAATYVTQSLRIPLTADSNPVTTVVAAPDLSMTKSHAPDFVGGGSSAVRLVVSNVGNLPSDGSTVSVTDPLPSEFTTVANPGGDGWDCSIADRTLTCTRSGALADGASFPPILIDVTIADPAPPAIVNTATVSGGGDANPDNNTATDVGGAAQAADLQITKTAAPSAVLSGQTVHFTLTVVNAGPSIARSVTVSDPLGADYRDVVATPNSGTCTTAVSCSLGDLARGESATITIDATVAADATTLTNTARVDSPTPDPERANNDASALVTVVPTADLRLTKTPSTTSPTPGRPDGLTYTIVATNAGPSAATGVVISDGLPPDFTPTAVSGPAGFTCSPTAATVVCAGGTIAAGASATLTVTGTVAASPAAPTLVNAAQVRADTADPNLADNADTAAVQARPEADIGVTKVWGGTSDPFAPLATTAPNRDVRVLLTMTNFGPSPASGAVLRDSLPAGATFVSSTQPATCGGGAGVVTCNVGSLAPGATFSVLVTVHVAAGAAGTTLVNSATGQATEPDPVDSNNSATDRLAVGTAADVAIQKRTSTAGASVGDTVTFTLAVTNNGPSDAGSVRITDELPDGLSFVSSPDCTAAGATVTCDIGTLASGATRSPTIVARVERSAAGTTVANTARVSSTTQDPEPANNADAAAVVIAPQADLRVVKRPSSGTVPLFEDVTYTLSVVNAGPNDATGVTVSDAVPAGMLFVSADPACVLDAGTASVTCAIGALAGGERREVTVTLRPLAPVAGRTVTNSASVTGNQPDPDRGGNTSDASIVVPPQADLALAKTASAASVTAGDTLAYTLVVTNAGPSTAASVAVDDPLPAAARATGAGASQGTCTIAAGGVTCALGDLPAGGQAQVTIVVDVAADAGGTTLENAATVGSAVEDPRPQDNRASVSTPVSAPAGGEGGGSTGQPGGSTGDPGGSTGQPGTSTESRAPALRISKSVDRTRATTADRLTFRIVVANDGAAAATGVVVTDTFGRPVTVLSVTTTAGSCTRVPLSCRIDSLAAGAQAVITLVVRARTAGTLTNGASVAAADTPGVTARPVSVDVRQARTALRLRKRADRSRVRAGGAVRFRVTVRNRGGNPALAVRVCDRLPAGLTFDSAPGARIRGRTACWVLTRLAAHRSRTFTINARAANVHRATRIRNRATAKGSNTAAVAARASVTVRPGAARGGGVTG